MGDVIVLIVLVLIVGLVLRSMYTQRKNPKQCTGDCTTCGTSSCKIDWDAIRKDIREQKQIAPFSIKDITWIN